MITRIYTLVLVGYVFGDFLFDRDMLIMKEDLKALGSSIILTPKEEIANQILMQHKAEEYGIGLADATKFNPARHFFQAREDIEASQVFKIIGKMPKGASLRTHDFYGISQEFFMNLTYMDQVYCCHVGNELYLKFLANPLQNAYCDWVLLKEVRAENFSYDEHIRSQFFLNVANPYVVYSEQSTVRKRVDRVFDKYAMFLGYKPVFQEQFYQSLLELYNDNVKYYEVRSDLTGVYDIDGRIYNPLEVAAMYRETSARFQTDHPDWLGVRLIYARRRNDAYAGPSDKSLQIINELHRTYPDFIIGFDICGHEDPGNPLGDFVDFVNLVPPAVGRFLHAGETSWFGESDLNVIDAVALNPTRIGHGLALAKHPSALKLIKKRRIAIEVCPISNQILRLVDDLRNHPATGFVAWSYPIVICSDQPTLWGASGLSYDFYMIFMAMTSKSADLRMLKQLALNSIEYSGVPQVEKLQMAESWRKDWDAFVSSMIADQVVTKQEL